MIDKTVKTSAHDFIRITHLRRNKRMKYQLYARPLKIIDYKS